jgi:hypothetical protein
LEGYGWMSLNLAQTARSAHLKTHLSFLRARLKIPHSFLFFMSASFTLTDHSKEKTARLEAALFPMFHNDAFCFVKPWLEEAYYQWSHLCFHQGSTESFEICVKTMNAD